MAGSSGKLFPDVFYFLSRTLPPEQRVQLSQVLDLNGGQAVDSTDRKLTHYVTTSLPGSDSLESLAEHSQAQLVTPLWVERTLVLGVAQEAAHYSPDPSMLFSGVVATSCDLSDADNEVLSAGISSLGGQWRSALTKDVTHLFAISTGSRKYETAMHFKEATGMKVVVPHWFDDVVRLGVRTLSTEEYEWPEPKLFSAFGVGGVGATTQGMDTHAAKRSKPLSAERIALYETALGQGSNAPLQTSSTKNVWKDLKIVLGSSLDLNGSQRQAHKADITREGGQVLEFASPEEELGAIEKADIYITRYRAGPTFVKAYRLNKTIGTLPWLWYVRATGTFSRPTEQLLHYPIPRRPINSFSDHIITVTNYTGKDREYIKKLITTMGAEFTASMSGKNTVVVAAYISGTKTSKAVSWGIPIVNHLWLEDCFSQWRNILPAQEKYVSFSPGIDFGTVLTHDRGLGVVRAGYDQAELDAFEKEIEEGEGVVASNLPPKKSILKKASSGTMDISMSSIRSTEEVENVIAPHGRVSNAGGDLHVGDFSVGAYQDMDIPLDEDGRISLSGSLDLDREQEMLMEGISEPPGSSKKVGRPRKATRPATPVRGGRSTAPQTPTTPVSSRKKPAPKQPAGSRSGGTPSETIKAQKPLSRRSSVKDSDKDMSIYGSDVDGNASAKKGSVIKTYRKRSRSRSRPRIDHEDEEPAAPKRSGKPISKAMKGKTKVIAAPSHDGTDSEEENRPLTKAPRERRKPAVPTDTEESEGERGRPQQKVTRRLSRGSAVSASGRDDTSAKGVHTPRRELSVVVPTLAQVRSMSVQRTDKNTEKPEVIVRTDSADLKAQEAPVQPKKRGRPPRQKVPEKPPAVKPPSPMPPPKSKPSRDVTAAAPVAGPSRVPESPASSTRSPSKRFAATKATQKLHDEIMPDVMNFQKELKSGHVKSAFEEVPSNEAKTAKKRASPVEDNGDEQNKAEGPEKKRRRTSLKNTKSKQPDSEGEEDAEAQAEAHTGKGRKKPASVAGKKAAATSTDFSQVVVMTTQVILPDEIVKAFTKLGGRFTTKASECTHLVARSVVRTEKFLCAMAVAAHIVTDKWIETCVSKKMVMPPEAFPLNDYENEKKYGFKLAEAVKRSKAQKGKLFEGKVFYVTPKVPVDAKLLKNVVTAGGGQILTQTPTVRILKGNPNRAVISAAADITIWRPLAESGYPIYSHELILTGTLKQHVEWDNPLNRVMESVAL
ncbi:hypothetical protein BDW22DRAFT_1355739 [Trametopsis cervina]|nr:hypothetical protein BDW22DRAFT_1355739 [Trametopsis cervina]